MERGACGNTCGRSERFMNWNLEASTRAKSKHLVFPQRSEAEVHPQPCSECPVGDFLFLIAL